MPSLSDLNDLPLYDSMKEAVEQQALMPMHMICSSEVSEESQVEAIQALRKEGVKSQSFREDGKSSLILATEQGNLKVIQALLRGLYRSEAEIFINYENPQTYEYALLRGVQLGHQKIVSELLSLIIQGAQVDVQFRAKASYFFTQYRPMGIVESESLSSQRNQPLICLASDLAQENIFKQLANLSDKNIFIDGRPVVFYLIEREESDLLASWIKARNIFCNLNLVSYEGISPLTFALEKNHQKIIQILVLSRETVIIVNQQTDLIRILMNLIRSQSLYMQEKKIIRKDKDSLDRFNLLIIDLFNRLSSLERESILEQIAKEEIFYCQKLLSSYPLSESVVLSESEMQEPYYYELILDIATLKSENLNDQIIREAFIANHFDEYRKKMSIFFRSRNEK